MLSIVISKTKKRELLRSSLFLLIIALFCLPAFGQNDSLKETKKEKIKSGWNFFPFPVISYNTDLGLQLGVNCTVFDYGKPTYYPEYKQKFFLLGAYYTKGVGMFRFSYDSKYLIKNHRLSGEVQYFSEPHADFFGFNGYESPWNSELPKSYYTFNRNQCKVFFTIQRRIVSGLHVGLGMSYFYYKINGYADSNSLFGLYLEKGIISEQEANGGNILALNADLTYDSRDKETDPTRGIYAQMLLSFAPDIIDREGHGFLKGQFSFSHYLPLYKERLTFAYKLAYQSTLVGHSPFYNESFIYCVIMRQNFSEGLGGINSIRGVMRNRDVGDGIAWLNAEFRLRFGHVRFLRQNWYFVVNPFFDMGMVVKKYRSEEMKASGSDKIYSGQKETPHMSAGLGLKVIVNQSFVVSLEFGKAFDKRDGNYSFAFGMNYIF